MDMLSNTMLNIKNTINNLNENRLSKIDICRILWSKCIYNNLNIIDEKSFVIVHRTY